METGIYPIEAESCDACGDPVEDLLERNVTRDYDRNRVIHRICHECHAVIRTAAVLSRAKGVEEAEIVPTLAFAAHAGQRPMALDAIMGQATWGTLVYDPEILVNERRLEPRGLVSRYDPQSGERYIGDPYDSPVEDLSEP